MTSLFPGSIQRQFQMFFILALGLAVLAMGLTWISHDREQHQREAERMLTARADLIGAVLKPALIFSDRRLARELLASSRQDPEILAVRLFSPDGELFVSFPPGTAAGAVPFRRQGELFSDSTLKIYRTILHKGSAVGVIYIESSLAYMNDSTQKGFYRVIWVMLLSLAIGLVIAVRMQKKITEPVADLADLMRRLGSEQNYSLRAAEVAGNREMAELASGFNQMAGKIQESFLTIEEQHIHLKESEERFRNIVELAPVPIVISRPGDGRILFHNRAAAQLSGLRDVNPDAQQTTDFYDNPDDRRLLLERVAGEGEIRACEVKGKSRWHPGVGVAVHVPDGVRAGKSPVFSIFGHNGSEKHRTDAGTDEPAAGEAGCHTNP